MQRLIIVLSSPGPPADSEQHEDAAGSSGAAGSSSAGAGASSSSGTPGGMRIYLSQIREWIVEFSCDMLFISMRTDVAWYRLSQ